MDDLVRVAIKHEATDIHIQENHVPLFRIGTEMISCVDGTMRKEKLVEWIRYLDIPWQGEDLSYSGTLHGDIRFRLHLSREHAGYYADLRILYPLSALQPDADEQLLYSLSAKEDGLILVCGPTGSGKTTALWRMLAYLNHTKRCHIITLEDPIELVVPSDRALITQRELHLHFPTFAEGVRQALRQDPDVILIGEMRDRETMDAALTAAETGHLVLSTLHTRSAAQAVTRFVGAYPGDMQGEVRFRLSMVLQAVLSQRRLCSNGATDIVREVLICSPAASQLIRSGRENQLITVMQTGANLGMRTMEQALQLYGKKGRS